MPTEVFIAGHRRTAIQTQEGEVCTPSIAKLHVYFEGLCACRVPPTSITGAEQNSCVS